MIFQLNNIRCWLNFRSTTQARPPRLIFDATIRGCRIPRATSGVCSANEPKSPTAEIGQVGWGCRKDATKYAIQMHIIAGLQSPELSSAKLAEMCQRGEI